MPIQSPKNESEAKEGQMQDSEINENSDAFNEDRPLSAKNMIISNIPTNKGSMGQQDFQKAFD